MCATLLFVWSAAIALPPIFVDIAYGNNIVAKVIADEVHVATPLSFEGIERYRVAFGPVLAGLALVACLPFVGAIYLVCAALLSGSKSEVSAADFRLCGAFLRSVCFLLLMLAVGIPACGWLVEEFVPGRDPNIPSLPVLYGKALVHLFYLEGAWIVPHLLVAAGMWVAVLRVSKWMADSARNARLESNVP